MRSALLLTMCFVCLPLQVVAEEPALPIGLENGAQPLAPIGQTPAEPSLPSGLGNTEPMLPAGLFDAETPSTASAVPEPSPSLDWRDDLPFDLTGFVETRIGSRLHSDATQKQASIGEGRLHLGAMKSWDSLTGTLVTDVLYDPVLDRHAVELENGQGWLDLREANLLFRPTDVSDVKIGRQVLTWGTGDLLFINDLFPKDWNSFFIGRDEEYLKAPSDAVKLALYGDIANVDIIYTPQFDADRFIDGRRISYYNAGAGSIVGRGSPVLTDHRAAWFVEDEMALRLHRMFGAYEMAGYLYDGFWKSPAGQDAMSGLFTFPELSVYGASVRGPLGAGIFNAETGYYDSRDDRRGGNPLVNNSEWRFMLGYERELWSEMTANVQYYQEWMQDYGAYRANLPAGMPQRDEHRHLLTLRLTQLLMNQNLTLSLFTFYSPSDEDAYIRPNVSYKLDDHWTASLGGNVFLGEEPYSFFGQFEDNSHVYASLRYGF